MKGDEIFRAAVTHGWQKKIAKQRIDNNIFCIFN
ncbi:hypothetical protein KSAC_16590 [Komagataeibacter saccharivorans]|nr:hypothetical protein KSAC_16590 [Komagataeibacter saccharivorans]